MSYMSPTVEQLFALDVSAQIGRLAAHEHYSAASNDMVAAIVEEVGRFAAEVYAPLNRVGDTEPPRWDNGKVTMPQGFKQAYRAFVEAGWGSIDCPPDYGGQGLPFTLAVVVNEALGTANMAFGLINTLTPGAIHALLAHGSAEQRQRWLPKLVSGEWNGTMNLTEPQAGSDVGAVRTSAERIDSGEHSGLYRIAGQKIFITFGEHDLTDNIVHLILARTADAPPGTRGLSLFLVPKYRLDSAGNPTIDNHTHCLSIEHKLGIHASPTCIMQYGESGDCIGELIGAEMGGMRAMFTMMNNARLMVGCQGVQIAERAMQAAQSYAAERVQSALAGSAERESVTIDQHPDVRRMLWRMRAQSEAARALVYYTAACSDFEQLGDEQAGARAALLTPLAKAHATDIGCEVASMALQVHGGAGYIEETGAAQYYRDSRIAPIYEGTNGIQAADLVSRKLGLEGGATLRELLADIAKDAGDFAELERLAGLLSTLSEQLQEMSVRDRLAASYPYLTMLSVAVCGWLMARQHRAAHRQRANGEGNADFLAAKMVSTNYYCQRIVPEAIGLAETIRLGDVHDTNDESLANFA